MYNWQSGWGDSISRTIVSSNGIIWDKKSKEVAAHHAQLRNLYLDDCFPPSPPHSYDLVKPGRNTRLEWDHLSDFRRTVLQASKMSLRARLNRVASASKSTRFHGNFTQLSFHPFWSILTRPFLWHGKESEGNDDEDGNQFEGGWLAGGQVSCKTCIVSPLHITLILMMKMKIMMVLVIIMMSVRIWKIKQANIYAYKCIQASHVNVEGIEQPHL